MPQIYVPILNENQFSEPILLTTFFLQNKLHLEFYVFVNKQNKPKFENRKSIMVQRKAEICNDKKGLKSLVGKLVVILVDTNFDIF